MKELVDFTEGYKPSQARTIIRIKKLSKKLFLGCDLTFKNAKLNIVLRIFFKKRK